MKNNIYLVLSAVYLMSFVVLLFTFNKLNGSFLLIAFVLFLFIGLILLLADSDSQKNQDGDSVEDELK